MLPASYEKRGESYEGAMSRWLMLKPEAENPPSEEEAVRKAIART